jgi:hypothetical protein
VSPSYRCDQGRATLENLGWLANAQWHTLSPQGFDRAWPSDRSQGVDPSDTCPNSDSCLCVSSKKAPSPDWETFCFSGSTDEQRRLSRVFIYRVTPDARAARGCAAVIVRTITGPEALGGHFEPSVEPQAEQEIQWRDRIGQKNTARLSIRRDNESKFVLRILWEKR